jgi:DNA-binding transcriptional LysR family regulator
VELRQFRYFIAVAEELHFSRAAARLNIGQPPLSLQIQAIERELGVTLLKRNRRRVELTDAGRLFLTEARETLAQAARAVETAKRAARGEVGTLRFSFTTSAPLTAAFSRAIRAYREALPEVHIELHIRTSQQILDGLLLSHVDVGMIRPSATATIPAGIVAVRVHSDRMMLVLPAGHPLADGAAAIPMSKIATEKFVLRPLGTGAGYYEQVFELCARAGFTPTIVQEASEPPTTFGLVAAGIGITIAPASLRAIQVADIVWREIDVGERAVSAILLVYNSKIENPLRDRFVSIARTAAKRLRS